MKGELGTAAGRSDLVHLALRLIVEEALEGEVADVLGRERYERGDGDKTGYRNGYRPGKVKTAEAAVDHSAPQVRDTPEPFVSGVRAALSGRTRELERLAIELYARGLSTREIEDTFTEETGRDHRDGSGVLSRPTHQRARRPAARGQRRGTGIIRAIEKCFPRSARQRCLAHRMRNLAARLVAGVQGAGQRLLSGTLAGDRRPTGGRPPRRLRRSPAERARLFGR
jgi:transposase-like protein